jgi:cytochrome c-type biogenesis protein CcmH
MAKTDAAATPDTPPPPARSNWLLLGVATVALAGAIGFAVTRGEPSAPAASPTEVVSGAAGLAALEARVAANPDDAAGWASLGEQSFLANNFQRATEAYTRATALAPGVAAYWSASGEAQVMASRAEPMPAPALQAFRTANRLNPRDPRARYFLAVKRDLDGDHQGAIRDWLALLADTPPGAPWEGELRQTIEQVGRINTIDTAPMLAAVRQRAIPASELPVAARAIPGPTRQQMQSAAELPKGQQDMMVQGMVDGLEARLTENPQQPDRWLMLMRSRMTLGEGARAADALRRAVAANPGDATRLRSEARMLGVPGA